MASEYTVINETTIRRNADGASIPTDDGNADYQVYKAWLKDGGTPEFAPTIPLPGQNT